MRVVLALLLGVGCAAGVSAQEKEREPAKRHGIATDLKTYPQDTPKEALASLLKAIEDKRIDYLMAQLADPEFVDRRLKETGGKFQDLVADATDKLVRDPGTAKRLQRYFKEGSWDIGDTQAVVTLKDDKERGVHLVKRDGRWFWENRSRLESDKK
jgi:hypothetical protein